MSCIQNNQQNVIFHVLELFFIIQPEPRRKQMGRNDRLLIIKINHVTRPGNTWMQIGIDPEGIFKNLREYAFYLIITPMRSTQNWKDLAEYKSEYDASYSKDIQGATGNTSSQLSFHRWYCTFSCNLLTSVCQIFARGRIRSFVCLSKPFLKAWKIARLADDAVFVHRQDQRSSQSWHRAVLDQCMELRVRVLSWLYQGTRESPTEGVIFNFSILFY